VSVPPLLNRPPPIVSLPPVIVSPDSAADAPEPLTKNTRLALLPLIDSRLAPGPVIVVVAASVSVSWPPVSVIVCGVLTKPLKTTVSAPAVEFAWPTAQRRLPTLPSSRVLTTVKVDGTVRSSSASRHSRARGGALRIGRVTGRTNTLRIQERFDMGN